MKLTAEQQAVVHHREGHARVAAVAGAGKTTTMAARVLHLLGSGVSPKRMLVLMFNRSAKDDFQRRLASMAPAGQPLPDVRTFHSLGHRLTQSLCRWGALAPRRLLSAEWQMERLLRQASLNVLAGQVDRRDAALEGDRLEALAHFCGLVKAEMLPAAALYERLNYEPDTDYFPTAFEEAERLLHAEGVMTYADLLYRPLQALEADATLRKRVEGFLDHVIVDEYQDINTVQQRLLAVLAGPSANVMAVGDANQCIYEWRGARPDTMLENFTATFGKATDYPLSMTFRHGHALALTANHAIMANQRRPDQLCLAEAGNPDTRITVGQGSRLLLDALMDWQAQGRALSDASLLVRSWALSVPFQLALLQAGIPFRLLREDRFVFRLPLVQALAGYLKLSRRPELLHDPEQLLLLLSQPTPFVARERLQRLAYQLATTQQWPERHEPVLAALKPLQRRTLKKRWELLCELPKLNAWPPAKLLGHVVEAIDAEKTLKRAAARRDKGEEDVRLLDVLIEQAESVQDPDAFIELLERPVENQAGGVLVSTVHGAKGLEWPLVAVAGVNEEDFPHYSRDNPLNDERLEEERRLFYVAITRAKEQLLVLHDGGAHRPSRFIAESAWQDGMRVAACLANQQAPDTPLEVQSPSLVARYLERVGRADIALAAPQVKESSAGYQAGSHYYPGQRLLHAVFGEGEVAAVEGNPSDPVIDVRFVQAGRRRLIARRAPIEVMEPPVQPA
ncbi:DNA helicase [Vreelandella aquamarina]|uniref:DNA 3'-5' helicase n=1 Tax=Vreelandella aquamarina TaxID=77097 RepID=A0A0D7UY42_9GAMM|nr:ATP-dependent helicase [Halomonas meridiana]KJD19530.1 DNA helicase UvrD [Halomonas meridiana]SIN60510.1 DNA helicase-2 / ATP-dependent DNA helicase PcrA [Halomonas meridiana]SIN64994.1 DNA helicase-2 / ATP-dependent DNA helicase PcrA [Halomonas meridiana]SIO05573.1 DNA helicase-2 / ATP-dependent DNA helicase PcrA [Halomonas meridiana]GED44955.1 DNA helicase [Halomonas meridiana]